MQVMLPEGFFPFHQFNCNTFFEHNYFHIKLPYTIVSDFDTLVVRHHLKLYVTIVHFGQFVLNNSHNMFIVRGPYRI